MRMFHPHSDSPLNGGFSRNQPSLRRKLEEAPKAIDLFCGAGGLSSGLKRVGFNIALAVDNSPAAEATFVRNFPEARFMLADINQLGYRDIRESAKLEDDERPTLISGGPPCQGFSSAGRRKTGDPRNTLVSAFAHLVAELKPRFFLFENVEGFLTAGRGAAVFDLLDPTLEAGYHVHLRKVNAANYGVPQLRKRVIAIGALGILPTFPAPTHTAFGAPGAHLAGRHLPLTPTFQEIAGDLEMPQSHYANHVREPLNGIDLQRCMALLPGQTMKDLPVNLQHKSYAKRANRRVRDGIPTERRGGAPAGLRKLQPDEPSKAITGAAINEFLHPSLDRFLTIRECARLQTFPDEFNFLGTRTAQALLIGNAVPPRLAETFGRTIIQDLVTYQMEKPVRTSGSLLSFDPTLSTGMSPALNEVVTQVQKRYDVRMRTENGRQLSLYA